MQKIFILDANEDFTLMLAGALRPRYLVEVCADGAQGLDRLRRFQPDVLILDLMLPNLAGMDVLQSLQADSHFPATIVVSRFFSDYLLAALNRYPIRDAILKPCSMLSLVNRVHDLCALRLDNAPDPGCSVSNMLLTLNMTTNKKGFHYARLAILMLADDPAQQVTKEIYPAIGKLHEVSATAVEKAIRSAIDSAWENRNDPMWRQYFAPAANGQIPKPTNSQFLSRLADIVSASRRAM